MASTTIKRSQFATYLDKDPGYEDFVLIGDGVTESAMEMNPNVSNEQYISEDAGNAEVESYAPTQPVQMVAKNGDDVFEFIENLRRTQAVLDDAHTQVVQVYLYETPTSTSYPATLHDVAIAVESKGGPGGNKVEIPFTIHYRGDPTQGTFDTATLEFTAT
ncbi:MAG: hypothetical protein SVT56_04940 [Chloroflexota bacterium]|nr:hypothetical protein [Chloroflexota bacterium]